jgi:HEXXH motif-containing protein
MTVANISEARFRDYLITSTQPLLGQFLEEKRRRNFGELFGYAAAIKTSLSSAGHDSGFFDYLSKLKLLKMGQVSSVWSTPAAYHWCAMMRLLIDAVLRPPSSSHFLKQYLEFLNLDLERALIVHLNDFGRFVASAYLEAGTEAHFDVPVRISLPNALPSSGIALHYGSAAKGQPAVINLSSLNQKAIEKINVLRTGSAGDRIHLTFDAAEPDQLTVLNMPRWQGKNGDIVIDSFEPCLRLPYVECWPRVQSADELKMVLRVLGGAIDRLMKYDAELVGEIVMLTHCVTPMNSTAVGAEMNSGTSSAIFGACFLSLTTEPLFVAEMLLHEFSHNKLRLLEEEFPLLLPESQNTAEFYSPWRDEPRPLEGIQHGLFVFSSIAYFWLSVYLDPDAPEQERAMAQRRVATLIGQLQGALAEFRKFAKLTSHGHAFLEIISGRIQDLERRTRDWDSQNTLPFFSGILQDGSLKQLPLAEALSRHRANWEGQFRRVEQGYPAGDSNN